METMSNQLHGIFKAILNGVHTRGEGGVLYVKGEECAYHFPREFGSEDFRGSLETVLEDGGREHFYVVEEKDGQLHVLAYPKQRVLEEALQSVSPPAATPPDAAN